MYKKSKLTNKNPPTKKLEVAKIWVAASFNSDQLLLSVVFFMSLVLQVGNLSNILDSCTIFPQEASLTVMEIGKLLNNIYTQRTY